MQMTRLFSEVKRNTNTAGIIISENMMYSFLDSPLYIWLFHTPPPANSELSISYRG